VATDEEADEDCSGRQQSRCCHQHQLVSCQHVKAAAYEYKCCRSPVFWPL
jgi:hypothetical protein